MSKIQKRIILLLFIVIMMIATLFTKVVAYTEYLGFSKEELKDIDNTYVYQSTIVGTKEGFVKVEEGTEIWVWPGNTGENEKPVRYYPDAEAQRKGTVRSSTLALPNVYCAEHGATLTADFMIAEAEYTVQDPMLAYILAQTPDISDMAEHPDYDCYKKSHLYNPIQWALWNYNYVHKQGNNFVGTDINILGESPNEVGDPSKDARYTTKYKIGNIEKSGAEIYQEADDYANGKLTGYKYSATFRALVASGKQRLLIVTGTKTEESNADVSLQKYITQVTHADGTVTKVDGREDTYRTRNREDSTYVSYSEEETMKTKTPFFKGENPVKIKAGDAVRYKITLYNNSDNMVNYIIVTDMFPNGADKYKMANETEWHDIISYPSVGKRYDFSIYNLPARGTYTIEMDVLFSKYTENIEINTASIATTTPSNNTTYRTVDSDYIQMEKNYKVSLEKYISAVNGVSTQGRSGKAEYLTEQYEDKTEYDTQWTQHNWYKRNHAVTVKNGDYVTYTITVRNDGEEPIYITEITDWLPEGVSRYHVGGYSANESYLPIPANREFTIVRTGTTLLQPGESTSVMITVEVSASNLSTEIFTNTAKITKIKTEDEDKTLNADEYDSTPFNNQDSDYFKMADIAIAGMVWQDDALNKQQDNYNGVYDNEENKISGIKVELYRDDGTEVKLVATTYTDANGNYKFTADSKVSPNSNETLGAIKLPNVSYYVVFEYDGITYTSTSYVPVMSQDDKPLTPNEHDEPQTSNAREKLNNQVDFDGIVSNGRTEFNEKFETINNNSGISYETENEDGYIPQSLHLFNDNMIMQSSTERITISNETQLQHINLGLRGRESFDLEIATDVYATKVTVNGVEGAYQYNKNTVTIRKADINVAEDAANVPNETRTTSVEQVNQDVRKSDIQNTSNTDLAIEVTYKITVKNASATDGLASLITDYFDSRYSLKKVYYSNENNTLQTTEGTSGEGYKSVTITLPEVYLTQGNTIDIYVVLNLDNASGILKELVKDGAQANIPTFNLAEIAAYKTRVVEGQSEFTRGLIDIDSAPGSANREEARLTTNQGKNTPTVNGDPTTVDYYFKAAKKYMNNREDRSINDLKLEDDTCDAPILYFASADNERTIEGTVFKDNTRLTEDNVKTGNGKFDAGEVGVYGVTVELVENEVVKQTTTTDKDGHYKFTGFLPGNYQIRYRYGNEKETVLLHQYEEGGVNQESFNGADYQSTNNTGTYDAAKLNDTPNYWYLYNERDGGISTATDNTTRRETVNQNSGNFTSEGNALWNKIRAGREVTESEVNEFIDKTKMDASTPQFHISVESTYLDAGGRRIERAEFGEYRVTKMNFGLAGLPMTSMKLQKNVKDLTIIDSTGTNVIAKITRKEDGNWSVEAGNIIATEGENPIIDVQVEDNKLQGAKLRVQYGFTSEVTQEKNFRDDVSSIPVRITGLVDFIDNDLLYNPDLDNNNQYWEIINHADIQFDGQSDTTDKLGTVDPDGVFYNTVVKAKLDNPLLLNSNSNTATITLEKQLSSVDSTFEDIATSNVDIYVYDNIVEITGLSAKKIETSNGIIIPGVQNDTARAEQITIHPPTGDSSIPTMYYIIGAISFVILAGGAFGIKKFVLTK